jgi:uncharacterized protein (DUF58 family)
MGESGPAQQSRKPPKPERAWVAAVRAWFAARVRGRVTPSGALYVFALLLTGLAAFASANNLLFLILAAMAATFIISGFISRMGIAGLELDVQLPDHISARRKTPARLVMRNTKKRLASFSVQVVGVEDSVFTTPIYFPLIAGGAELETSVNVVFARRGTHRGDSFEFSSRFPFGFAERRIRVLMNREVLVYPALDAQAGFARLLADIAGESESPFQGRGHDFYRIRPYEPFESSRHVDWRSTAHTGELQVREFAKEQEPLISILLDLQCGRDALAWFERAVEGCAYLAWETAQRGARVRFATQDWEILTPVEGDVYDILKYLALVQPRGASIPLQHRFEPSVTIVFTSQPSRVEESAWAGARLLHPGCFPFEGTEPDAPGAV